MIIIRNEETDPYFNLAAEEYLLKSFDDDIFTLWRNENSIVVGKHQNAMAEINYEYVRNNNVNVIRRLSGGGTVFHDLGNINFTFISNALNKEGIKIDFKYFTAPVIEAMHALGVNAGYSGRNDLLIDGLKFSGNAEHIYHQKKRTLHHGTMLYTSELSSLSAALKVDPLKFEDKAVKSVRSKVTNISSHLKRDMDITEFYDFVFNFIAKKYPDCRFYEFTESDKTEIRKIADEKYRLWEWNFGYSPKYRLKKILSGNQIQIDIEMFVEKGIIREIVFTDVKNNVKIWDGLSESISGKRHDYDELHAVIDTAPREDLFEFSAGEILKALF